MPVCSTALHKSRHFFANDETLIQFVWLFALVLVTLHSLIPQETIQHNERLQL
jgi:hypothetical protein